MTTSSQSPCPGPLDLTDADLRRDPYPVYRWYREHDPVHCLEPAKPGLVRRYLLTRWEDVEAGLKDLRLGREVHSEALWNQAPDKVAPEFASYARVLGVWPLFKDPPRHARVRRPINRVLNQAMSAAATPLIGEVVDNMVSRLPARGPCELISSYASLVPLELDCRLFGLDDIDAVTLGDWLQTVGMAMGNVFDENRIANAARTIDAVGEHIAESARRCRSRAGHAPMLQCLLELAEPGGMIGEEQVIPLAILLLQAAQDSVIGSLANGILTFLRHPDQRRLCQAVDGGFLSAVDEVLRFESPVQQVTRHAIEALAIRGVTIRRGEGVSFLLGAANRDPQVFKDPDRFDVRREIPQTASFGFGLHRCPGADLGRVIAARSWQGFFARFPDSIHSEEGILWRPTVTFRTVARLPVVLNHA